MKTKTFISIITFLSIAFGLTFAISKLPSTKFYSVDIIDILCGFGPLLSGLICYRLFSTPTTYSIEGTQPLKAWLIVLISVTTYILTNSKHSFAVNCIFLVTQLLYCFGEEFGWRHYLQSATNNINKWLQPLVIGLVWFAWHFSWLDNPMKAMFGQNANAPLPIAVLMSVFFLTLFSLFMGWIVKTTDSILFPTLIHFVLKANAPTATVAVLLTILAVLTWDKLKFDKPDQIKIASANPASNTSASD